MISDLDPQLQQVTNEIGGDYDLYMYVRHSGEFPWGKAGKIGSVCDKDGYKFMFFKAYGPEQCQTCFLLPEMCFQSPLDCSATNRLLLTAEVVFEIYKNRHKGLTIHYLHLNDLILISIQISNLDGSS